jgi:hypothetical protein
VPFQSRRIFGGQDSDLEFDLHGEGVDLGFCQLAQAGGGGFALVVEGGGCGSIDLRSFIQGGL